MKSKIIMCNRAIWQESRFLSDKISKNADSMGENTGFFVGLLSDKIAKNGRKRQMVTNCNQGRSAVITGVYGILPTIAKNEILNS